jgi:DNA (cytosine-5)-methyltransferase 1
MRHGSLFSGIGGFDLAAEWMGWENVFQVEWDSYCQKILTKNFPNVKRYGDIKEFDGTKYRGLINILTGGFPCQPFSVAGKQKGKSDDRHLWPEMLRVIREIQPPWIVGENVPGIIAMELDNICLALESEGYEVQPFIIPSASIGAWDKRERVWIIAHSDSNRKMVQGRNRDSDNQKWNQTEKIQERENKQFGRIKPNSEGNPDTNTFNSDNAGYNSSAISQQQETAIQFNNITTDIECNGRQNGLHGGESGRTTGERIHYFKESDWWKRNWVEVASELCRGNARVPHRMDRIKGLGNSVNPYVPYQIFKAIEEFCLLEKKE